MEKREPSCTVGGNVNCYSHHGEQYGGSIKTKNRVTIWSSNPTPGHISSNPTPGHITIIQKDTCIPMFIAALFTIAKTWKQPKCPSTDEWIKKMWHIYTMDYYSAIKKNEIMPYAATWMDLETTILSEVSQTKTNIIWYHSYVKSNFKKIQMNLFTKQKETYRYWKTYGYQRGKVGVRDELGGRD